MFVDYFCLSQRLVNNTVSWNDYTAQVVALKFRDEFTRTFPLSLTPPRIRRAVPEVHLTGFARTVYAICTVGASEEIPESGFVGMLESWKKGLKGTLSEEDFKESAAMAFAVLAATAGLNTAEYLPSVLALVAAAVKEDSWTVPKFVAEFNQVPELKELISTPFMLQVRSLLD